MRFAFYGVVCFEKETGMGFDVIEVVLKKVDVVLGVDLLGRQL